jgi:hypothetical protein
VHGQYYDMLTLMDTAGQPKDTPYLFLGDYVDRSGPKPSIDARERGPLLPFVLTRVSVVVEHTGAASRRRCASI